MVFFRDHPCFQYAGSDLLAQLAAHPLYCLASQINFARWHTMLRCHTPSPAHAPHWHVTGIDVGLQQRRVVLCRGGLLCVIVQRLLCVQGEYGVIFPRNLAQRIASRRHFLGSKLNEAEDEFEEGHRLCGEQRFSEAMEHWGRAALLHHGPSHAHLSKMLIDVAQDGKQGFEIAASGVAMGCAHSKGALGHCYVRGYGVAKNEAIGLELIRASAAAGSCIGQFALGACYYLGSCIAQDYIEAARLYSLAAAQGNASAQNDLGYMFEKGQGVVQDYAEAVRLYRLAAKQGDARAQYNLSNMFEYGNGVARDREEAKRWNRLAAVAVYRMRTFSSGMAKLK